MDKMVFHIIRIGRMGGVIVETLQDMDFTQMKQVDIRTVDRESLVDINEIQIDENLSKEERFVEFLRQVKNPYCYRCGKMIVKVSFSDTEVTLEERLEHCLKNL